MRIICGTMCFPGFIKVQISPTYTFPRISMHIATSLKATSGTKVPSLIFALTQLPVLRDHPFNLCLLPVRACKSKPSHNTTSVNKAQSPSKTAVQILKSERNHATDNSRTGSISVHRTSFMWFSSYHNNGITVTNGKVKGFTLMQINYFSLADSKKTPV